MTDTATPDQKPSRGCLVAVEGVDGAGTTTIARMIAARIGEHMKESVTQTAEPWDRGGRIGMLIRSMLNKESPRPGEPRWVDNPEFTRMLAMLFAADRLDHVHRVLQPAMEAGHIVVTDRYTPSSIVYQGSWDQVFFGGDGAPLSIWPAVSPIIELNDKAPMPAVTIFLDADPEVAVSRIMARGGERDVFETRAKVEHHVRCYRWVHEHGVYPMVRVDANQPIHGVFQDAWDAISAPLSSYIRSHDGEGQD